MVSLVCRNGFSGMQECFSGMQECFSGMQECFSGMQEWLAFHCNTMLRGVDIQYVEDCGFHCYKVY